MKNVFVISCYVNTEEKKKVLIDYINQIKKMPGFDILLVSHIPMSEDVVKLVNYFIYDSDNFLLPMENTPVTWFAVGNLKINIFSCRHGYAFIKNVHNALKFIKSFDYDTFIFSDYDNILNDNDISKIENIPQLLVDNNKKMFVFKDYNPSTTRGYSYESKFFAANVSYFADNVRLPNSYEQWCNIEPFCSSGNVVEDILVLLWNKFEDQLYIVEDKVNQYFSQSNFDVFHHYDYKYSLVYNLNDRSKPLFFYITPTEGEIELLVNNKSLFNLNCYKSQWLLQFIDVDENDSELIFKRNGEVLLKKTVNINTLNDTKNIAFVYTV